MVFPPVREGLEGFFAHSSRQFDRHSHDAYALGYIRAGGQRWHSGRGQMDGHAGNLIMSNPGEVHDGNPLHGTHRPWCMIHLDMALFAVTKMLYFCAPVFLKGSPHLAAFTPEQLEALARVFLSLYGNLSGLFMLFYGTAWMIRGWLTWRSTYLPRFLDALMVLAGAGFFAANVAKLAAPGWSPEILLAPMFVNAVVLAGWMIFKGVDQAKWDLVVSGKASA